MRSIVLFISLLLTLGLTIGSVIGQDKLSKIDPLLEQHPYLVDIGVVNGKHFYSNNSGLTWQESNKFCQDLGIHWGRIDNMEENQFVMEYLNEDSDIFYAWLSVSDLMIEGIWKWGEDNSPLAFANWAAGQPDGGDDQNCARLYPDGSWRDFICNDEATPLCFVYVTH